jgi:uncharacterized protein (TIGR00369 family)
MSIWKIDTNLDLLNARGKNTLVDHLGIEFIEVGKDFMIARMTIQQHHKQPMGIMHGGVSCVLAETVGSTAANYCVDEMYYCVGLDINTNHLRAVKGGDLLAKAIPYHIGKSTQVWGIEIKNKEDQLISINRLTMAVLKRAPLMT